ncbi:MAG: hypothetical protein EPN93_21595 [Spirochaetes bacterium]|nr:MAG: hypothetical protein EPN93_21595 [Spirochaetota bacterium]
MKSVVIAATAVLLVSVGTLAYLGFFGGVEVNERVMGPYQLVFREHRGDYGGTALIQDEICGSLLDSEKITATRSFGLYYDDPRDVKKENLRSIAGCILDEADYPKIPELRKRYQIREYPRAHCLVAEFPYKGVLSVFVGVIRVYPRLDEFIKEKRLRKGPVMEIFDIPGKKITYLVPQ